MSACSELPEVTYVTDRLHVATAFSEPICEGTLADFDDHVDGVEDALGRPSNLDPIVVYWLDDVSSYCGEGRGGCFFPGTRLLFSTGPSITHEIVHAVLDSTAHTYFVEEGLAEIYSGVDVYYRPSRDDGSLGSRLSLSKGAYRDGKLDYAAAAHFMRYVHRAKGEVAMRSLADVIAAGGSTKAITATIEDVFGRSIGGVEDEYFEEAPSYYRGFAASEVATAENLRDGLRLRLDCEDASTRGPLGTGGEGIYQVRRVGIERGGPMRFEVHGDEDGWVTLFDPTAQRGIVTNWSMPVVDVDPDSVTLRPGQAVEIDLEPGTHLLVFGADADDTTIEASLVSLTTPSEDRPQLPEGPSEGTPEGG
jgi:hypothetical protein